MARDFYPRREAIILGWSANFSSRINSDPRYQISPERAAEFAALQAEFAAAYALATAPGTNSESAVARKESARIAMERAARLIVRVLRGNRAVSAQMRIDLGINPRRPGGRSPRIQRQERAPMLQVMAVIAHKVYLHVRDRETLSAVRKPHGTIGSVIRTFVGEQPPANLEKWRVHAQKSRARTEISFDDKALLPGTKVWITAQWMSPSGQLGPPSPPIQAFVDHGLVRPKSIAA